MTVRRSGLSRIARRYGRDTRGVAAVELALWISALTAPILSAVDLGFYAYQKMELNNAAQTAAQAAWSLCSSPALLPAATNCTGLQTALATAAHSTGLGTLAALQAGSEGYYCLTTTGALQLVGTAGAIPTSGSGTAPTGSVSNCSSQGSSFTGNTRPSGDYVQITVNYTYTPVFPGLTMLGLLPTTISCTAWMRLS
jgi:Flp pilus assembly protein TadG